MKKYRWIAYTLLIITVLLIIYVFISGIYNRSVTNKSHTITTNLINDNFNVYKNSQGIIHIVSNNDDDMFFGLGYIHAQQHLWSMCLNKYIIQGRLSELYGKDYLQLDQYMRILSINETAKNLFDNTDSYTKNILQKYTDGINTYIEHQKGKYSIEFNSLDIIPEKWNPEDCFAIQRYWSFLLSSGFTTDIALSEIGLKIGFEKTKDLIPNYNSKGLFVIDYTSSSNESILDEIRRNIEEEQIKNKDSKIKLSNALQEINNINKLLNKVSSNLGSNIWVINKPKNTRIKTNAILSNDFHYNAAAPTMFFQVHITSPNYNVTGLTIPGMPIFLCGINNNVSWGMACMRLDDVDFFIEKTDDKNENYFVTDTRTQPIKEYLDTIRIKNEPEKVYYIRYTNTSRILSDIQRFSHKNSKKDLYSKHLITFRWTGTEITNEIGTGLKIMQANNWKEFYSFAKNWKVPGMVISFADKMGNIGTLPAGLVPKRGSTASPNFISEAWINTNRWQGFHNYNFNSIYNPSCRYILCANNAVQNNLNYYVSSYWATPERAERIKEGLSYTEFYSYRDAQYMQTDILSIYAKNQINSILYILKKHLPTFNAQERKAYYKLRNWDYIMSTKSTTSTIYNKFLNKLLYYTFHDELDDYHYNCYLKTGEMPLRKINELLLDTSSIWFNNKNTHWTENQEIIVLNSFKSALKELTKKFNTDNSDKWHYKYTRTLEIKSPYFTKTNIEQKIRNMSRIGKTFTTGGNSTTINVSDINVSKQSEIQTITVARFIADMHDGSVYTILAGGNSGDIISPNYSDQINLWKIGAYLKISTNPEVDPTFSHYIKFEKK